jgi:hypothetical protein
MVATVEHIRGTDMLYGRHYDLGNRYIIYISLMTTDMFYGRHHDLGNHYIISISPRVMVATVEHICGH